MTRLLTQLLQLQYSTHPPTHTDDDSQSSIRSNKKYTVREKEYSTQRAATVWNRIVPLGWVGNLRVSTTEKEKKKNHNNWTMTRGFSGSLLLPPSHHYVIRFNEYPVSGKRLSLIRHFLFHDLSIRLSTIGVRTGWVGGWSSSSCYIKYSVTQIHARTKLRNANPNESD